MIGSLEEQLVGMVVCDEVCLGVGMTSSLPSCDRSPFALVGVSPRRGSMTAESLLETLFFRQIQGVLPALAVFSSTLSSKYQSGTFGGDMS